MIKESIPRRTNHLGYQTSALHTQPPGFPNIFLRMASVKTYKYVMQNLNVLFINHSKSNKNLKELFALHRVYELYM